MAGVSAIDANLIRNYYRKHECLTGRIEDLFDEEIDEIWAQIKQETKPDFDKISEKTLVHVYTIEQMYSDRFNEIVEYSDLLDIFQPVCDYDRDEIVRLLTIE
jgi:uncharacterized damage-inducible protein DinB